MRDADEDSEQEEASDYDASDASYEYDEDSDSGMHLDNHTDEAGPSTSSGPGWSVLTQGKRHLPRFRRRFNSLWELTQVVTWLQMLSLDCR